MIRKLTIADFGALVDLAAPYLSSDRLPFNRGVAKDSFVRLTSDKRCLVAGEFDGDELVGAVALGSSHNTYAQKQHASMVFWFGSIGLFDYGVEWAMSRPVIRCVMVMFDREVREGIYKLLQRRGFERCGDMRILWR